MSAYNNIKVLVTGGSGFLGAHCILTLLRAGYAVKTTIRSSTKESNVRQMLTNGGIAPTDLSRLSFTIADLMSDASWPAAVSGCTYVLHLASPFPATAPKNDDELILPAREGTLRVLRAAAKDGHVKRVVLTSSFAAVAYGNAPQDEPYDEKSWTNVETSGITAYQKSKTLAERAAWDFVRSEDGKQLELSVINPVGIYGPVLGNEYASSVMLIEKMLTGKVPGCLQLEMAVVDVRDVADLHLIAMTHEKAAGERFIAAAPPATTMQEIALTLKERLPNESQKVPTRILPNFLIKALAWVNKEAAMVAPLVGVPRGVTNHKAVSVLGWKPRSREDAITATAESLIKFGLVKV